MSNWGYSEIVRDAVLPKGVSAAFRALSTAKCHVMSQFVSRRRPDAGA